MPKINHFVILMQENRSFDHMFGFATPPAGQTIDNLAALPALPENPLDPAKAASAGNPSFPASQPAPFAVHDKNGPSHSFNAVNTQLAGDAQGPTSRNPASNNGFVKSYASSLRSHTRNVPKSVIGEVMQSFAPDQLPAINQLAQEFCLCDAWYCEVPGPTMPNRMFIHAATSEGYVHNVFSRPFSSKTVYELFEEKGLTWAIYFHDLNEVMQFRKLSQTPDHFRRFDRYASDVAAGTLANYSFICPRFNNTTDSSGNTLFANSQHAPEDVRFGDLLIADVYDYLAANPTIFNQTVLVITYDEHGGFFDHVIPGPAPSPDGIDSPNPDDQANFLVPSFSFDRIGVRVPTIIVSPWIGKGIVEHRTLQHTSVIKTVTEIFGLEGPLNERDKSANSFADLFDKFADPRADMPAKLTRPSLEDTNESVVADVPMHPADEPLDEMTHDWALGMLKMIRGSNESLPQLESVEADPQTQGEAAAAIEARLQAAGL
jgi:phospholipase C